MPREPAARPDSPTSFARIPPRRGDPYPLRHRREKSLPASIRKIGKELGRDHDLAHALWATGVYEARLLCAYVGDPERLTSAEADRWCRDFDNWGVCDTLCFCLFDRTPFASRSAAKWCGRAAEFTKRAGFALMASLAGHDKKANDQVFLRLLPLCEKGASDDRNFVKKAVSRALQRTGGRSRVL